MVHAPRHGPKQYAYFEGDENCWNALQLFYHAVVLNEICLSEGFCSRMVRCMPMDLLYRDCHCVTEVYSAFYDKWIVLDAANRAYYVDRNMIPLNLFELRECVMREQPLYVPLMARSRAKELFQYLARNLVRFETDQISRFGAEDAVGERVICHFQSANFPVSDKTVDFPREGVCVRHVHTACPGLFWAKPQLDGKRTGENGV